jgi:FkbM family methyltransferase
MMRRFPRSSFLKKLFSFYDPNNVRRHSNISIYNLPVHSIGRDGEHMLLDLNQHIDYKYFFLGYFDDLPGKLISRMGSSRDVLFIDVGANIGLISIPIALKGYQTVSIEPLPHHIIRFRENLRLNPAAKLLLLESSVGSQVDEGGFRNLTIFSPPGNSGASSSDPNWNPSVGPSQSFVVPLSTVDELCADILEKKTFTDVLIKIDVEGMELEVMSGCKKIIEDFRPVILFEWKPKTQIVEKYHKLKEFLLENSYRLQETDLVGSGVVIEEFNPQKVYENLLMIPTGRTTYPI